MQPNETKTTFTPGPWAYDPEIQRVYSAPTNRIVAAVFPADYAERAADIALIAAAPDLYAALDGLLGHQDKMMRSPASGGGVLPADLALALGSARAALRRARGEG